MDDCIDHGQKGMKAGYGNTYYHGQKTTCHRAAYCKHHGVTLASIAGKVVQHACDNPRCINPAHLVLGTQRTNIQDAVSKGRHPHGVTHGSAKMTPELAAGMRLLYMQGDISQRKLAELYGVSQKVVNLIVNNKAWV